MDLIIRYHMVFHHNQEEILPRSKGHVQEGVSIIISSALVRAWKDSGSKPSYTTLINSNLCVRFIRILLKLPRREIFGSQHCGKLTIFLALVYPPVNGSAHEEFNDVLSMLFCLAPKNSEIIDGHDSNSNIGIQT